jgi:P27 family predicted phage terminase small subunit
MGRGRKPTPKPILQIRGARVRGPHKSGIDAPPGVPPAPTWLCPVAKKEWQRIVPMLEASRVMSPRHQQTLAAYCDSFADMVQADEELKANGTTIMDDKGRVSNHPAWLRKRDARNQMLKFAAEFGLTASALARVSAVDEKKPEDEAADSILFG